MTKKYKYFREFWPFYVQEHKHPLNRRLHFLGTALALGCVAGAAIRRKPRLLFLAPIFGYFFAWLGHFVVEKNRPATFQYPLMSLCGDFKMFALMATGRMDEAVQKVLLDSELEKSASERVDAKVNEQNSYELGQLVELDHDEN